MDRPVLFCYEGSDGSRAALSAAGDLIVLGLVVRPITDQTAQKIHTSGVIIQSVKTGSFADLQGLEPGLVIVRINKKPTGPRSSSTPWLKGLKTGDDVVFEVMDPRHPENGINYVGGTL